jgi:hypothetical protein
MLMKKVKNKREMISVVISGEKLVSIRSEMLKGEELWHFVYQMVHALYENRDKTVDVAFMLYLDRIGYSYLRAFHFVEVLPIVPFTGEVQFTNGYDSVVFNVTRIFDSSLSKTELSGALMQFGCEISQLLR